MTAPRDWKAFWASLTPREAFEALDAAPKVAGPWLVYGDDDEILARSARVHDLIVYQDEDDPIVNVTGAAVLPDAEGYIEFRGRDDADEALRAAGWLLVEDEGEDDGDDGEGDGKPKRDLDSFVNSPEVLQAGGRLVDGLVRALAVADALAQPKQKPS
jgi:hypothetical protein